MRVKDADTLIAAAKLEEQRTRRVARVAREVLDEAGPPIRVRDVAAWAGFSKAKLMADAKAGELRLVWRKCGTRRWAFVERDEARRYLCEMECSTRNTT